MPPRYRGDAELARQWAIWGGSAGIAAVISFLYLVFFGDAPPGLLLILAGPFGLSLSVNGWATGTFLDIQRASVGLRLARLFMILGGFAMTAQLVIQLVMAGYFEKWSVDQPEQVGEILRWVWQGGSTVHLDFDVVWDVYLIAAGLIFAWALQNRPGFGWFYTVTGIAAIGALAVAEVWAFPLSPQDAGLPYLFGPLVSL